MCLFRGKVTHYTCYIFWLTVVFDGFPAGMLPVAYDVITKACTERMRQLTVKLQSGISLVAVTNPAIASLASGISSDIQHQRIV